MEQSYAFDGHLTSSLELRRTPVASGIRCTVTGWGTTKEVRTLYNSLRPSGSGQVGFVVDKVALGQVVSECFGFHCQSSFHQILHPHNHPGQVQYARSGRRAEWTQFGLHSPLQIKKKKMPTAVII
jgi:hypothetical protein